MHISMNANKERTNELSNICTNRLTDGWKDENYIPLDINARVIETQSIITILKTSDSSNINSLTK